MQGIGDVFNIDTVNAEFPNAHRNFYSNNFYSNNYFNPRSLKETCGNEPIGCLWNCDKHPDKACCIKRRDFNSCKATWQNQNVQSQAPIPSGSGSTTTPPADTASAPAIAVPHDSTGTGGDSNTPPTREGEPNASQDGFLGVPTGMWIFVVIALVVISILAYKNLKGAKKSQ